MRVEALKLNWYASINNYYVTIYVGSNYIYQLILLLDSICSISAKRDLLQIEKEG